MCQKNYTAQGTTPPYRLVKFGSADRTVAIATAATDLLIGVTGRYKDNVVAGIKWMLSAMTFVKLNLAAR